MQDLNQFSEWYEAEKQYRSVCIELKPNKEIQIFVHDRRYPDFCLTPKSVSEIDFEGESIKRRRKQYEELKAEFEPQLQKAAGQ